MIKPDITPEKYQELRDKYDLYHAERERQYPGKYCFTPEMCATLPPAPTHDEISAIEVYEFITDPPDKYFLYIDERRNRATTWTGELLGQVLTGRAYYSNMNNKRVPVTVKAINGYNYHGTYYKSAGDYARIKRGKPL